MVRPDGACVHAVAYAAGVWRQGWRHVGAELVHGSRVMGYCDAFVSLLLTVAWNSWWLMTAQGVPYSAAHAH